MDSRSELAAAAGVSPGNIRQVKQLIESAHPIIKQALKADEISIHLRMAVEKLPAQQQLEKLEEHRSLQRYESDESATDSETCNETVATPIESTEPGRSSQDSHSQGAALLDSIAISEIDAPGSIAYFTKSALRTLRSIEE